MYIKSLNMVFAKLISPWNPFGGLVTCELIQSLLHINPLGSAPFPKCFQEVLLIVVLRNCHCPVKSYWIIVLPVNLATCYFTFLRRVFCAIIAPYWNTLIYATLSWKTVPFHPTTAAARNFSLDLTRWDPIGLFSETSCPFSTVIQWILEKSV